MAQLDDYIIVGVVSAVVTLVLTPLTRALAVRVGAVADPGDRKVHEVSTPSLGGLAMLGGIGAGLLGFDGAFKCLNSTDTRDHVQIGVPRLLGGVATLLRQVLLGFLKIMACFSGPGIYQSS